MSTHVGLTSDITGNIGVTLVTDTATHTPASPHTTWYRFVPLQNSVIATLTASGMDGNATTAITINNGNWLECPGCTSFKLTSGSGILYYAL